MTGISSIFKRIAVLALCYLAILTASRLILIGFFFERVSETGGTGFILLQGLRFDIILLGLVFGPIALVKPWLHTHPVLQRIGQWIVPLYLGIVSALAFFVEASTASYILEFDSRPNYVFVEYLLYPNEVFATVFAENRLELVVFTTVMAIIVWTVFRWLRADPIAGKRLSLVSCAVTFPVIALVAVAMVRSTLDHRPVNASVAAFSRDSMVNQLPLNSPYTLLYAIYERQKDTDRNRVRYGHMEDEEVLEIILAEADIRPTDQLDASAPTLRYQSATRPRAKPLNLVIILEEGLGAQFVGSLGGMDLTPNLDRLADEGIAFDRLYATGGRSVRGIESVISCVTPMMQLSVVKRGDTQRNFFTIASLLERSGYETSFIYGGQSYFDNMKQFFMGNGFQTVVDQNDFEDPVFAGSWGVSDEDLFERAHKEFSNAGDEPFFSLVFTSSNHPPYEIPEGRVEPGRYGPQEAAIKYADYALGQFFDKARGSDYWEDTVFLVVADHSVDINGGTLVPTHRYRIPGVILGGTIEPRRIAGITSQIDLIPTLLSLVGVSSSHPCIGRDLTRAEFADGAGRASMQFWELQAYIEEGRKVVLQPDLDPVTFRVDPAGELEQIEEGDARLERKALAYALWAPLVIRNKAYFNYPDDH